MIPLPLDPHPGRTGMTVREEQDRFPGGQDAHLHGGLEDLAERLDLEGAPPCTVLAHRSDVVLVVDILGLQYIAEREVVHQGRVRLEVVADALAQFFFVHVLEKKREGME